MGYIFVSLNVSGCILASQEKNIHSFSHFKPEIIICDNEIELINTFIQMVNDFDPEIICGYEVN